MVVLVHIYGTCLCLQQWYHHMVQLKAQPLAPAIPQLPCPFHPRSGLTDFRHESTLIRIASRPSTVVTPNKDPRIVAMIEIYA